MKIIKFVPSDFTLNSEEDGYLPLRLVSESLVPGVYCFQSFLLMDKGRTTYDAVRVSVSPVIYNRVPPNASGTTAPIGMQTQINTVQSYGTVPPSVFIVPVDGPPVVMEAVVFDGLFPEPSGGPGGLVLLNWTLSYLIEKIA